MSLKITAGTEVDVELLIGRLERSWAERHDDYRSARRALGRHIAPDHGAQVPASIIKPLAVDLGSPAPGLLWKVRSVNLWGDNPLTSPVATSSPVDATSGVVANANAVATMPAVAGKTNVLNHLRVEGLGATAGTTVQGTITGVLGGTREFEVTVPAGVGTAITPVDITFPGGLQATGPNVAIVVTVPAFGAGNVNAEVNIEGTLQTGGPVTASLFVGQVQVPNDLVNLPDLMSCVAPNISVPTSGPVALNDVICTGLSHVYALFGGIGLTGYNMMYATADVLEAVDTPETLSWL